MYLSRRCRQNGFLTEVPGDPCALPAPIREGVGGFDAGLDDAHRQTPCGVRGQVGFIRRSTGPMGAGRRRRTFKRSAHGARHHRRTCACELLARRVMRGTTDACAEHASNLARSLAAAVSSITDEIASFAWTDSEVQSLHRAPSTEMSREVRALAALAPFPYSRHVGQSACAW